MATSSVVTRPTLISALANYRLSTSNQLLVGSTFGLFAGLSFLLGWPLLTVLLFIVGLRVLTNLPFYGLLAFGALYMVGSSVWFFPGTEGLGQLFGAVLGTLFIGVVFHGLPHILLKHRLGWLEWPFAITAAEYLASQIGLVGVPLGLVGLHSPFGYLASFGSLMITSVALCFAIAVAVRISWTLGPICLAIIPAYLVVGLPYEQPALPLDVAAIQHNPPSVEKWHPETAPRILADLIARTEEAGSVDLVVWPENAVTTTFDLQDALSQVRDLDVPLLFGMTRYRDEARHDFVNSAILRVGGNVQLSNKQALVPVIESGLPPMIDPVIHPADRHIFELPNGMRFLTLLCYEVSFPIPKKDREGVSFIVVISAETGLFTQMTAQVYDNMAIARSLETGIPVLRVGDAT